MQGFLTSRAVSTPSASGAPDGRASVPDARSGLRPVAEVEALPARVVARRVHACLECGAPTASKGDFCATACRSAFNNRRKARGAELYDLFMAHRFDRETAQALGVMAKMNRLASFYRGEDETKRGKRRSWRRPADVLADRPWLSAVAVQDYTGRGRR